MVTKKRRTYSEADKTRFAEQRRAQLEAMQAQITQQTTELVQGDQWQEWLRFSGRFHSYSFFNVMLIMLQKPDASLVAGYRAWQAKGRQVQKGETGVRIMAPVLARADVLDKAGNPVLDENGKPKKSNRIVNVKPATVFDVSQTCGEPIPERPHPQLLKGQSPEGLWESLTTLIEDRGYQVQRADCGTANGVTDFVDRTVTVRPDLDDAQAAKTLIHEAGHVLLHEPDGPDLRDSTGLCRGEKEVEAESVAFLVANAHGLDTSDYTFAYVASWASNVLQQAEEGTTLAEIIAKTGQRVVKAAHTILDATQPEQTLDETTSELAAEAAVQIAEDRQTVPAAASAQANIQLVADEAPRIEVREPPATQVASTRETQIIDPSWENEERLARAMLSMAIQPGDPSFLHELHQAGNAAQLVADVRSTPPEHLPPSWQRNLANVSPEQLVDLAGHYELRFILPTDAEWPATLDQLSSCPPLKGMAGAPIGLWVGGHHKLNEWIDKPITITGARASTRYGDAAASDLAEQLSESRTIVSGAGQGIDTAVHRAVMAAGGRTLVICPGISSPLPLGHWELDEHLAAGNIVISEVGPRAAGRRDFLVRSRLLAAVGEGTVIVEAVDRATVQTTVVWSNQLGKPTMAVPGPVTSATSAGCHQMIRDGHAILVANADQINAVLADSRRQPAPALARAQRDTGIVLQDEAPAVAPTRRQIRKVFEQHDSARFDTFGPALDAAQQITSAGVIGAVRSVRTYDPNSVVDGEVEYLTEAHETVVFENQQELDRWVDINGLRAVEGRNDNNIMTSIDPYQHPDEGHIEVHELCVQRPAAAVAPKPVLEDRDLGRRTIQDALFAAFPSAASASKQPTAATPSARTPAAARTAVPAMER